MDKWILQRKGADFKKIAERLGVDPILVLLMVNRGIPEEKMSSFLAGTDDGNHDPLLLKGMKEAIEILGEKIRDKKQIRIIGDYDIDGVMATYILLDGLQTLGAHVTYRIPDRVTDGYGINEHLITEAHDDKVDTIVTCDNGITAREQTALAKTLDMTMIITDHHDIREGYVPDADAVINPKQTDCPYPCGELCGAAVAYKLICALFSDMGCTKLTNTYRLCAGFATIGDVVPLIDENRLLAKEMLEGLRCPDHKGLSALMKACEIDPQKLNAYHIGFVLGPCINASGRIDTADRSLALMMASDDEEATMLACELKELNEQRKAQTIQMQRCAEELIETSGIMHDRVLVVYLPQCHESLAGIIAGRIKDRYNRPAFVLTNGAHAVKGSGRSIEEYPMSRELEKVSDLLVGFGGHPMAAGLSLEKEMIEPFREKINELCTLSEDDLQHKVLIDAVVPFAYWDTDRIRALDRLEPYGVGNRKPLFAASNVLVSQCHITGKNRDTLKLRLMDEQNSQIEAVRFQTDETLYEKIKDRSRLSITYYPSVNVWNNRETVQIVIRDIR